MKAQVQISKNVLLIIMFIHLSSFSVFAQSNMLMIGDKAPAFIAQSTNGEINFPNDYFDKWTIIFSHPADFTAVCSTELIELAKMQEEFAKLKTKLIVLSVDGITSHIEWVKSLEALEQETNNKNFKVKFPIVSDVDKEVANLYGMIHKKAISERTVRTAFIIDPDQKVRALFYYPNEVGRNLSEIKRTLLALQLSDKNDVIIPANWEEGDDVMIPSPKSISEAQKIEKHADSKGMYSKSWYMWYLKQ